MVDEEERSYDGELGAGEGEVAEEELFEEDEDDLDFLPPQRLPARTLLGMLAGGISAFLAWRFALWCMQGLSPFRFLPISHFPWIMGAPAYLGTVVLFPVTGAAVGLGLMTLTGEAEAENQPFPGAALGFLLGSIGGLSVACDKLWSLRGVGPHVAAVAMGAAIIEMSSRKVPSEELPRTSGPLLGALHGLFLGGMVGWFGGALVWLASMAVMSLAIQILPLDTLRTDFVRFLRLVLPLVLAGVHSPLLYPLGRYWRTLRPTESSRELVVTMQAVLAVVILLPYVGTLFGTPYTPPLPPMAESMGTGEILALVGIAGLVLCFQFALLVVGFSPEDARDPPGEALEDATGE